MGVIADIAADGDQCKNCGRLLHRHYGGKHTRRRLREWDGDIVFATIVNIRCANCGVVNEIFWAIQERAQDKDYQATIYIHGLQFAERQKVRPVLKEFNIRVRKLGGLRDKSSAFIRLADALAGFIREYEEGDWSGCWIWASPASSPIIRIC